MDVNKNDIIDVEVISVDNEEPKQKTNRFQNNWSQFQYSNRNKIYKKWNLLTLILLSPLIIVFGLIALVIVFIAILLFLPKIFKIIKLLQATKKNGFPLSRK